VIYTAPSSIEGSIGTATVVLRNYAGTFLGQQVITVYNAVTVTNKAEAEQGYTGETTFTVQGGDGYYSWTVKKDGNLVDLHSGASYVFNATGDGAAGIYTITVSDGNNFTDSFEIDVPDSSEVDVSDSSEVDVSDNISPLPGNSIEYNSQDISGYIVDDYGYGIGYADVKLLSPKQFSGSTVTDSDGYFSFSNIPGVNKYHFSASKNGYISTEFTTDDLLSGNSQNNIILENADTYIAGNITIDGAAFSGAPVEVTISYIINDFSILAGKGVSSNGEFRIDFEEVLGVSEYILTAARPGEYGETTVGSLPESGVTVNIDTDLYGDDVSALAGGSSRPVSIAGQSVSIIRVPFGGIDPASGVTTINIDITTVANTGSVCTSGSGSLLYNIDVDYQDITTILTLPFDLTKVSPGDFENGIAVIYHADTLDGLTADEDPLIVDVTDIISIDYIGDGSTGLVEFYADSLSVFGIGTDSTNTASSLSTGSSSLNSTSAESSSGGGDAGGCFITTIADAAGGTVGAQGMLILFGVIMLFGVAGFLRLNVKAER
jgi:hypothetical protein